MSTWDAVSDSIKTKGSRGGSGGGELFMKLTAGKHKVRLVGDPLMVNIAWVNGKKFIVPEAYEERVSALADIRQSYAVNVIDRNDEKLRFKILEKGPKVFSPIITQFNEVTDAEGNRIHPGKNSGQDWMIIVDVPSDPRRTDYNVVPLAATPFTDAEKELISRTKDREKYQDEPIGERGMIDLVSIYSEEKAAEKLDELLGSGDVTAKDDDLVTSAASDSTPAASSEDTLDSLF